MTAVCIMDLDNALEGDQAEPAQRKVGVVDNVAAGVDQVELPSCQYADIAAEAWEESCDQSPIWSRMLAFPDAEA